MCPVVRSEVVVSLWSAEVEHVGHHIGGGMTKVISNRITGTVRTWVAFAKLSFAIRPTIIRRLEQLDISRNGRLESDIHFDDGTADLDRRYDLHDARLTTTTNK